MKHSMKPFIQTTVAGFIVLIIAMLIVVAIRVEEQRDEIEGHKDTIRELNDSLHSSEIMYLKCIGSVETEQHGAHYSDGKIKFYKTND